MPFRQRALTNGLVSCAAVLGNASTYPVFGFLIDHFGWPTAFGITGLTTVGLALLWIAYATDYPKQHAAVNDEERLLIEKGTIFADTRPNSSHVPSGELAGRWYLLLRNRSLVFLTLSYAAVGYFEYASFFCLPRYIKTLNLLDETSWRNSVGIINLAMAACMPLGGFLSDLMQRLLGYRWGRAVVPGVGMALSDILLVFGLLATSATWIVLLFALAMGAHGTCEGPFWTTAVELGGSRGGTSAGIFNTGGNVLGSLAPTLTPLIGARFGWHWGLGLASIICLLGAFLWLVIDPAERYPKVSKSE
jgi:MFS family permease